LISETFLLTSHSDPKLIEMAEQIASERQELGIQPFKWKSTYTEGAIGAKYKYRVLTIASFRRDGLFPEWHRTTDVVENVDAEVLGRNEIFLWELLQTIDRQAK
jgi:hypothetical protein